MAFSLSGLSEPHMNMLVLPDRRQSNLKLILKLVLKLPVAAVNSCTQHNFWRPDDQVELRCAKSCSVGLALHIQ